MPEANSNEAALAVDKCARELYKALQSNSLGRVSFLGKYQLGGTTALDGSVDIEALVKVVLSAAAKSHLATPIGPLARD
jgi:hypothetical protein